MPGATALQSPPKLSSLPWPLLRTAMLGCTRCAALVRSRSQVVPGAGAIPATVAFVGLAPERLGSDRTGIPFSGDRSGELLRRMIRATNLRGVFITNIVRCNPRDARGRNRDPSAREIANRRGHLDAELAHARPRIVAGLGRIAWRAIAGRGVSFMPRQGAAVRSGRLLLFPMYHPAYVIRGAYSERAYACDFDELAELVRTTLAAD